MRLSVSPHSPKVSAVELTNFRRKNCFVVQHALDPGHEAVYVVWCTHLGRLAEFRRIAVLPVVFVSCSRAHRRTLGGNAEFGHCAVQHIDMVEKVHSVHGKPFVQIFAVWKHYCTTQIAGT